MIVRIRLIVLTLTVNLLVTVISYAVEASPDSMGAPPPAATSDVSQPESNPSGFIGKMEYDLKQAIREERMATLSELDKERRATLVYMTHERLAATEDLKSALNRLSETLVSERQATLVELEAIGDRIVSRSLDRSKSLIDHFFVRLFQLIIFIGLASAVIFFIVKRGHVKSRTKRNQQ